MCNLCGQLIDYKDQRISLVNENQSTKILTGDRYVRQRLGLYHLSCWNKSIRPYLFRTEKKIYSFSQNKSSKFN